MMLFTCCLAAFALATPISDEISKPLLSAILSEIIIPAKPSLSMSQAKINLDLAFKAGNMNLISEAAAQFRVAKEDFLILNPKPVRKPRVIKVAPKPIVLVPVVKKEPVIPIKSLAEFSARSNLNGALKSGDLKKISAAAALLKKTVDPANLKKPNNGLSETMETGPLTLQSIGISQEQFDLTGIDAYLDIKRYAKKYKSRAEINRL